jgi:hypothetical protein
MPKAQTTKNKWIGIKIKILFAYKDNIQKMERQTIMWQKIFSNNTIFVGV